MAKPNPFRSTCAELKRTARLLLDQLRRDQPTERPYAVIFDVDVSETYAIRVAATEESLTRLAERYLAKGYRVRAGNPLEVLRACLRWDAPGDDRTGWYWGNQDDDAEVTRLLAQAVQMGMIREFDESQPLQRLCLEALGELEREGAFGTGDQRERMVVGVYCVNAGFSEEDLESLASINPPQVVERLRREFAVASEAWELVIRPRDRGSKAK